MTLLPVTTDVAGVERFAYQLFARAAEETARPPTQAARLRAAALDPARLQQELDSPQVGAPAETPLPRGASARGARSPSHGPPFIPLAYRLWLAHLLWLEEVLHTLDCRPADVTAVELAGLQALARARARFLEAHEFCPRCHAPNPRWTRASAASPPCCRRCHQEL